MGRPLAVACLALLLVTAGCASNGAGGGSIGLAAGGAQDANAFRTNVDEGYVPQPTDITYEGLFHDYYFDTGQDRPCSVTFCPSYSRAVARDPISNETERFLTVGLNSGLSEADFERKTLNLVVVLDVSGSMNSPFNRYYYDDGERRNVSERQAKIRAATDAVATLTTHLEDDDRLGIVAYSNGARTVQRLRSVGEMDMDRLRRRLTNLDAGGGTNLESGMQTATTMLRPHEGADPTEYENRIIYVTDAMPNLGDTGGGSLKNRLQSQADRGIHTTFVGVGVDFNSQLTESIATVRGANYYAVHSPGQFQKRMDEGFDHMVTPLVFDLTLRVESDGYRIERVYGSPNANRATGEVMHVATLFPSRTEANRTEGGVILLELERTGGADELTLSASYETRAGERRTTARTVQFGDHDAPYFETSGARKAVALTNYATLMRNWAAYERSQASDKQAEVPDGVESRELGQWEQRSVDLRVTPPYDRRIREFTRYFRAERRALGDEDMEADLAVLRTLRNRSVSNSTVSSTAAG